MKKWRKKILNKEKSFVAQMVKNLSAMQKTWVPSLAWEDALEEGMATHFSSLAWKIPWREEPGRLQSAGCIESDTTEVTKQKQHDNHQKMAQ